MERMTRGLMALVLTATLVVPACGDSSDAGNVPAVATFEVARRDLRVTVTEKGTLKATNQILIRSAIPGQAKIMQLVDEGKTVAAGDILCELDSTSVVKEIGQLEDRVIQLQAEVAAADAELEIQLSQNEADQQDAELELKFAHVELERYQKGEFVQEQTRKTTKVEEATSSLERARRKYQQMPALLEEGFVTSEQVEEERINQVKAESDLELAKLDLSTYLRYTAPKELQQREADVRNAELAVDRVKQRGRAREAQKRSNVDRQKRERENVVTRLTEQNTNLENMVIRAPGPGIVVYGDARNPWEDREIKVGETVYSKQAFLTLPDLSEMQVVLAIHEADISRMATGQKAFVTVETARNRTLDAEVTKVALVPNAQRRRWGDNTKRFRVEVSLTGELQALELKPGLTSRVEILVDELKDVLAVPVQAVFAESGEFWVFKRTPTGFERAIVKIAPGNGQYTVVTEGLAAGEHIALYNPERAADVSPSGSSGSVPQPGKKPGKP